MKAFFLEVLKWIWDNIKESLKHFWLIIILVGVIVLLYFSNSKSNSKLIEDNKNLISKFETFSKESDLRYKQILKDLGVKVINNNTIKEIPDKEAKDALIKLDSEYQELKFNFNLSQEALKKTNEALSKQKLKFGVSGLLGIGINQDLQIELLQGVMFRFYPLKDNKFLDLHNKFYVGFGLMIKENFNYLGNLKYSQPVYGGNIVLELGVNF